MAKYDISVTIRKNELAKIAKQYPKKANQVVRKAAFDIIKQAAPYTPYKTGDLSSRVTVTMVTSTSARVDWEMFYGIYQNFGTRYISGKFFANKASDAVKPGFVKAMKAMLQS